ncbi:MAG: hypothetical protein IKP69_08855 [Oscillospiraceae bacterium]|nr:hypothetical protein [Oscillospiraceae bacterium]
MKKIIAMLTATVMFSLLLTGCGISLENNSPDETAVPDIQIAAIPIETQSATSPAPVSDTRQQAETQAKNQSQIETTAQTEIKIGNYTGEMFEKAIFAALLRGAISDEDIAYYTICDADKDNANELLAIIPYTEGSSENLVFEHPSSPGFFYYDATGANNDYYAIDPSTEDVYLCENTRSRDGSSIVAREYFHWSGRLWQSTCMLYGGKCYWNYANTTEEDFLAKSNALIRLNAEEDILNLSLPGTPETAAEAFYKYLSKYFAVDRPLSVDIDGNGSKEQVVFVQNLPKSWWGNMRKIYESDSEHTLDINIFKSAHTTCFVFDTGADGNVRVRSENFDRKYRFAQYNDTLVAYDENNDLQTISYAVEDAGFGKHIMSVIKLWE